MLGSPYTMNSPASLCVRLHDSTMAEIAREMGIPRTTLYDRLSKLQIDAIHDDTGYRKLRRQLSEQYDLGSREPNIQVWNVDLRGDRSLTLRHFTHQRRKLGESFESVLEHLAYLWGFCVRIESQRPDGSIELIGEKMTERRQRL